MTVGFIDFTSKPDSTIYLINFTIKVGPCRMAEKSLASESESLLFKAQFSVYFRSLNFLNYNFTLHKILIIRIPRVSVAK